MSDYDQHLFLCAEAIYSVQWAGCTHREIILQERGWSMRVWHAQLNHKSIKYNWHEADVTVLEGILARGDRKIGQALLKVYEKGGIFGGVERIL